MSIFPTKILLATDGSKDSELAADAAIELANQSGSELHVVYVGEFAPSPHADPSSRAEQIIERLTHRTRNLLGERIGLIAAAGGDVSGEHVRVGRPANEIVDLAEEIGAGLIVVGSRGQGAMRRALMGSVSDSVVRHAYCPVLVVRGEKDGEPSFLRGRILLATDGSTEATLAAQTAVGLADKTNSELHVVYVGWLDYGYPSHGIPDLEYLQRVQEKLTQEARKLLAAEVEQVKAAGASEVEAHLSMGSPEVEIVKLAEEIGAGLIVVGSRGLGGLKRALLGSVSDSVVHHAHCPVLVVRKEK